MESQDVNPPQLQGIAIAKQESPVKDAVRSLEAQLASEVSINPVTATTEEDVPVALSQEQTAISLPLKEVVINTQVDPEGSDVAMAEQHEIVETSLHHPEQQHQVEEHVIPMVMHISEEHQHLQEQHQQIQDQHQELQQQQQLQQLHDQQQIQQIHEQQVQQQIPDQQNAAHLQMPAPGQHQQSLLGQQQLPEQLQVQLVEEQQLSMETEQSPEEGTVSLSLAAGQGVMQIVDNADASHTEIGQSVEGASAASDKPFFKCVAVTSDGSPDWSKVMNLNQDILKEVLEKHGISMDTSGWKAQTKEGSASRKRKKKAKKAKKKKMKEKTKTSKAGDSWCATCCRQFDNPGSLKHHLRMHDEDGEGPRKCSICSLVFQRKIGLRAHMRKSHPDEYNKDGEIKDDGDFICEETDCDRTFTTKMGLSQHINQHHKGLGKKKSYVKREPGDLKCDQCDKTFTMPHKLTQHVITHSDARPFTCSQCDGTFKHHSSLRTHELIHSNKDACSCPVCGTMFKRAQYVRRHMIRVHDLLGVNYIPPAPVKRYPCELCHRAYERRSELSDHMNSHTGAKPHLCEICAKGFGHKRALDVHRKTHTGKGAFHCDVCGKVFGSKSRMREHRVIHTGEKPFICQQCGSRFAHRANLREHLKSVHKTGVEPLPRGRRKGQRKEMTVQMLEAIKEPEQQQVPQQTLQYEVLTTRPHPQIDQQGGQQQVQTTTQIVPIGIQQQQHHQQQVVQVQQPEQQPPQQIMYQEIQLQPVVVQQGNSNMRTMQVQQVQGNQIETRHDDLASVAQIVLQLHTEGTYTVT